MRSRIRHAKKHPLLTLFKTAAIVVLVSLCAHAAYAQGVRHAILSACPYIEDGSVMIDYDGQVHEYFGR